MAEANRAFVTGATGFLGSALTRSLVDDGWQVSVLMRPGSDLGRLTSLAGRIDICTGDVTDCNSVKVAMQSAQPGVVFHLAGNTRVRHFDGSWDGVDAAIQDNFLGTLNVVRAIAESEAPVEQLVRAGGLEEYGRGPVPGDEAQRELPSSPYSASQVSATHWCQMLQPHLGFGIITLRPALVYGPAQGRDFLIPALIGSLLQNRTFAMTSGTQRRDYIHIDDVVRGFRLASAKDPALRGAVINLSSGQAWRVADVAMRIAEYLDCSHLLRIGDLPDGQGGLANVSGTNDRAAALLGWRPEIGLDAGLSATIDWYRRTLDEGKA